MRFISDQSILLLFYNPSFFHCSLLLFILSLVQGLSALRSSGSAAADIVVWLYFKRYCCYVQLSQHGLLNYHVRAEEYVLFHQFRAFKAIFHSSLISIVSAEVTVQGVAVAPMKKHKHTPPVFLMNCFHSWSICGDVAMFNKELDQLLQMYRLRCKNSSVYRISLIYYNNDDDLVMRWINPPIWKSKWKPSLS